MEIGENHAKTITKNGSFIIMATNTFLDYLQQQRKKYVLERDGIHGVKVNNSDFWICTKLIWEYDEIIKEYKKHLPEKDAMDFSKITCCSDCPECVIYNSVLGKCYCNTMKGKTITKPEMIQDWCPFKED